MTKRPLASAACRNFGNWYGSLRNSQALLVHNSFLKPRAVWTDPLFFTSVTCITKRLRKRLPTHAVPRLLEAGPHCERGSGSEQGRHRQGTAEPLRPLRRPGRLREQDRGAQSHEPHLRHRFHAADGRRDAYQVRSRNKCKEGQQQSKRFS